MPSAKLTTIYGPGGFTPSAPTPPAPAPLEAFARAIRAAGLEPPPEIHADGELHRFASRDRRGDDAGWYVLHLDGIPAGAFGDWRTGAWHKWCAKSEGSLSPVERAELHRRLARAKERRDAETAQRHDQAREKANTIWQKATPTGEHPYLTAKAVKAYGVRVHRGALVIPMRDNAGELHSLQIIAAGGEKRYLSGGAVSGNYYVIGQVGARLLVCEGYATAATIHEATGHAVAVAFNAGNLVTVAKQLRALYPAAQIVVCADNDQWTPGNPGLAKGQEAAQAVGGLLAVPAFNDRTARPTDMNDLAAAEGRDAVRKIIEAAGAPAAASNTQISAADLVEIDFAPINWIVPGIIPAGVALLCGSPKIGKSWLALDLAIAVASGGTAFGSIACDPGNVLYLALEDNRRRLKSRLLKRLRGAAAPPGLILDTAWPRADQGGIEKLDDWLTANPGARMVIIDTLARFRAPSQRNTPQYEGDYAVGAALLELAARHNVAIVLVHHTRKAEADDPLDLVSGTLGLSGGVDGVLVLRRDRRTEEASLFVTGRDVERDGDYALSWDAEAAGWLITGTGPVATLSPEQRQVLELIQKHGPIAGRDLARRLHPGATITRDGKEWTRARALARKLRDAGLIEKAEGGYVVSPLLKRDTTHTIDHTDTTGTTDTTGPGV